MDFFTLVVYIFTILQFVVVLPIAINSTLGWNIRHWPKNFKAIDKFQVFFVSVVVFLSVQGAILTTVLIRLIEHFLIA